MLYDLKYRHDFRNQLSPTVLVECYVIRLQSIRGRFTRHNEKARTAGVMEILRPS